MKSKIAVAMSGGVDSSVTAALLQSQGHEVVGFHLVCWHAPGCPAEQEKEDARRVAGTLGIKFYVFDATPEYRSLIIEEMVAEYAKGRTPNPDVWCNERIKFGFLLDKARAMDFELLATGHYAQLRVTRLDSVDPRRTDYGLQITKLFRGIDPAKDQSYFLWRLNQDQLSGALFPVGDKPKATVRALAKKFGLHTATKKDSQGVCFVGDLDMRSFIKQQVPMERGEVKLISGKSVGEHDGLFQYTIGQRAAIGGPGPFYVVALDQKNNTLIVTTDQTDPALYAQSAKLEQVQWISGTAPSWPLACEVAVRYHATPASAILEADGTTLTFAQPVRAVTPGQSAVMYVGDELVGGGVITSA